MENPGADPAREETFGRPDFTDITHLIINNLGKMAAVNSSKILGHQAQSYLNGTECPWSNLEEQLQLKPLLGQ